MWWERWAGHRAKCMLSHFSCVRVFGHNYGLQPARLLCPWGFSKQEYWVGWPCPPPGDLPNSRTELLCLLHWQAGSLPLVPPRSDQDFLSCLVPKGSRGVSVCLNLLIDAIRESCCNQRVLKPRQASTKLTRMHISEFWRTGSPLLTLASAIPFCILGIILTVTGMAIHPSILAWESHGQRSLMRYSP